MEDFLNLLCHSSIRTKVESHYSTLTTYVHMKHIRKCSSLAKEKEKIKLIILYIYFITDDALWAEN